MRFLGNFIVFGFVFYLISMYQPELFQLLVVTAERSLAFAKSFLARVIEGMNNREGVASMVFSITNLMWY